MFTEEKLEQHYSSIPSDALHIIRDEYKWALEECGVKFYFYANAVKAVLLQQMSLRTR